MDLSGRMEKLKRGVASWNWVEQQRKQRSTLMLLWALTLQLMVEWCSTRDYIDVGTPDHVNVYNELKGGTYQELDLKGREEEHHYQRLHTNREREG